MVTRVTCSLHSLSISCKMTRTAALSLICISCSNGGEKLSGTSFECFGCANFGSVELGIFNPSKGLLPHNRLPSLHLVTTVRLSCSLPLARTLFSCLDFASLQISVSSASSFIRSDSFSISISPRRALLCISSSFHLVRMSARSRTSSCWTPKLACSRTSTRSASCNSSDEIPSLESFASAGSCKRRTRSTLEGLMIGGSAGTRPFLYATRCNVSLVF